MTKMDEEMHPECDIYIEDERASVFLKEILVKTDHEIVSRLQFISFGSANVGQALGQMVQSNKFPRPSLVFLDGDQSNQIGCTILPGGDAPERVVFECLASKNWAGLPHRAARDFSNVADVCSSVMTSSDHHSWVQNAATKLLLGGDVLWQMMCAEWASHCLSPADGKNLADTVKAALA